MIARIERSDLGTNLPDVLDNLKRITKGNKNIINEENLITKIKDSDLGKNFRAVSDRLKRITKGSNNTFNEENLIAAIESPDLKTFVLDQLREQLKQSKGATFGELKKVRSTIGELLKHPERSADNGAIKRWRKLLYGALSEDLSKAANEINPHLAKKLKELDKKKS